MGWESVDVVRFDLGPLPQGQMRIAKLKSAYNSLIIGPRGLEWKPTYRKSLAGNLLVWSDLTLDPAFKANVGGHGGRVVTLSPPTSEAGVRSPARPQVGKLVVACCWSAVYSTEP